MARSSVRTDRAPAPAGGYSQGLQAGNLLFVSGQGPFDPVDGHVVGGTIEEQTRSALDNVQAIVEAAGLSLSDVVRIGAFIDDFDLFDGFDATYRAFFTHEPPPARTTVACELGGILIEIDAIALGRDSAG